MAFWHIYALSGLKQRKATPADWSRWDRFAYKLNSNELLYIFCIHSTALRLMQAVWFPPSPCQRKNGSANTKRSPSKALNEVINLCQNHWRRPKEFCKANWGDWMKKPYSLRLDGHLCICGYSSPTNCKILTPCSGKWEVWLTNWKFWCPEILGM